jgi:hypothetical protein
MSSTGEGQCDRPPSPAADLVRCHVVVIYAIGGAAATFATLLSPLHGASKLRDTRGTARHSLWAADATLITFGYGARDRKREGNQSLSAAWHESACRTWLRPESQRRRGVSNYLPSLAKWLMRGIIFDGPPD